jgi:four helix bundle suffix protein
MRSDGKNVNDASDGKHPSHDSHHSQDPDRLLPPRGDYQTLLSFQKAEIVYDITFRFAHKYLSRGDRTVDQMIQSARSGKKNILEGSKAALTSKETEIKLTNVARASLEELLVYLIDQQLRRLEKDFVEQGGLRERMTRARLQYRNRNNASPESYDSQLPPPKKPGRQP